MLRVLMLNIFACLVMIAGGKDAEAAQREQSSPEHCSETLWGVSVHLGNPLGSQICVSQLSTALGLQPWPKLEACAPGRWDSPDCPQLCRKVSALGPAHGLGLECLHPLSKSKPVTHWFKALLNKWAFQLVSIGFLVSFPFLSILGSPENIIKHRRL